MRVLRLVGIAIGTGVLVAGAGMLGTGLAWAQATQPSAQATAAAASAQGAAVTRTVLVPQCQVVYETVQGVECVQVPVTRMQTCYRTEYRTEAVPVTRYVPEVINESRTITVCVPKEQTTKCPVTRVVCEQVTTVKRFHHAIPVTKQVQKVVH